MKTSEILRNLADMIDAKQQQGQSIGAPGRLSPKIQPKQPVTVATPPEDTSGLAQQPDDIFIPPLQLKIELLKKATGVENVYDDQEDEQDPTYSYDELDHIKRNAGISVVALDALGDDEPLDV
jgi:hypothetical protein